MYVVGVKRWLINPGFDVSFSHMADSKQRGTIENKALPRDMEMIQAFSLEQYIYRYEQ